MRVPYNRGWHSVRAKRSGKFEARWADENGQARGKSFLTETQANKYAMNMAIGILDGAIGLSAPTKSVEEAYQVFMKRRVAPQTLGIYERHLEDFFNAVPVTQTGHLTADLLIEYDASLQAAGHNPGGRRHILKTLKTFTRFCVEKNWLLKDPFFKFAMPKTDFAGRALSADEFAKMTTADPRYEVDVWISRALRIGNPSMLRISQVWKLTAADFKEPNQLRVVGIKGQDTVTITLHPSALQAIKEVLPTVGPGERLFKRWPSVDAMRQSFRKRARRAGLAGVRFHDAGKVTRVTDLDGSGYGLGEISELSNTSRATLAKFYIRADRRRAFDRYQTYGGPTGSPKTTEKTPIDPNRPKDSANEIASNFKIV